MSEPQASDVPEGAAVFPLIPDELGVHPLLLAALHSYVFLEGSEDEIVNPLAANEAMEYLVTYLQRLDGRELQRVREDFEALIGYAREQKWPKQHQVFLKSFLQENGIGTKSN
jgi:hypothetical protein